MGQVRFKLRDRAIIHLAWLVYLQSSQLRWDFWLRADWHRVANLNLFQHLPKGPKHLPSARNRAKKCWWQEKWWLNPGLLFDKRPLWNHKKTTSIIYHRSRRRYWLWDTNIARHVWFNSSWYLPWNQQATNRKYWHLFKEQIKQQKYSWLNELCHGWDHIYGN